MISLGIESTAHTFGIGIIDSSGKVLADQRAVYKTGTGGMIPHEVAAHHRKVADETIRKAFDEVGFTFDKIDIVSYSAGPGLGPSLLVGFGKAKELAQKTGKPLVGINHPAAHLSIGLLTSGAKAPVFLYVSGVNTQLIIWEQGKFRIMGETLDIGLGNALDKFGREVGLGFPAGPLIEEVAKKGKYVKLPYVVKGMDTSFSGILTACIQQFKKGIAKEDLCFSFQETAFAMLTEAAERALAHTEKKELLLVGGVGANKRFCEMLDIMCKERGATFYNTPMKYCADNGVMIAWEGLIRYPEKRFIQDIDAYWRVDEV